MAKKEVTRKSCSEYKKEYLDLLVRTEGLKTRIANRLVTLCNEHPDAEVGMVECTVIKAKGLNSIYLLGLNVEAQLLYIDKIEKWLKEQHPHKQTTISYSEICNCDKRDMPVYNEDGKNWCPQCGYQVL